MPIGRAIKRPRLFNWGIVGEKHNQYTQVLPKFASFKSMFTRECPIFWPLKGHMACTSPPQKLPNYRLSDMVFILISNAIACWSFWKVSVWLHFWENANGLLQNPWLTGVYKLAGRMDLSAVLSFTDFTGLLPVLLQISHFFQLLIAAFLLWSLLWMLNLNHFFYNDLVKSELVSQSWCSIAWKIL